MGLPVTELAEAERKEFREQVRLAFASECRFGELWDYASDGEALYLPRPWDALKSYPVVGPVVLFFEPDRDQVMLRFESLADAATSVEAVGKVEFAAVDIGCDWFVSYNHSEFLILRGSAANWVT
jgi:hypothetical protein